MDTPVIEIIRLETQAIKALTAHIRSMIERLTERHETVVCRGCGDEVSGEFGDICAACEREQEAERDADMAADDPGWD